MKTLTFTLSLLAVACGVLAFLRIPTAANAATGLLWMLAGSGLITFGALAFDRSQQENTK